MIRIKNLGWLPKNRRSVVEPNHHSDQLNCGVSIFHTQAHTKKSFCIELAEAVQFGYGNNWNLPNRTNFTTEDGDSIDLDRAWLCTVRSRNWKDFHQEILNPTHIEKFNNAAHHPWANVSLVVTLTSRINWDTVYEEIKDFKHSV